MKEKVISLKKTVKLQHHSKEGLMEENGKTVYNDSWCHPEVGSDSEKNIIREINKRYNTIQKSISLEIDLEKARVLHREKLVRKRVPVKGEDGKIFYRMQWVDPHKDMSNMKSPKQALIVNPQKHKFPDIVEAKKKQYDLTVREGHIEKFIDDLSKQEKEQMLKKYNIKWDTHAHPMKNWMNAIVALKKYVHEHPEIANAEHLPKGGGKGTITNTQKTTPEGTNAVQDFMNNTPREKLYSLMKEVGITDQDPNTVSEYVQKKTAPIRHMNNMGKLKKYLNDNPQVIDKYKGINTNDPPITTPVPGSKPTSKVKSKAQQGGNTIMGVLHNMSSEELYQMMKEHGINDGQDPRLIPGYQSVKQGGNGKAPIMHMNYMCKLKALIEKDPNILNYKDKEQIELSDQEKDRIVNMDKEQKQDNYLKEFMNRADKDLKEEWLKQYADKSEIKDRKTSDNPNIDWMYAMSALKQVFKKDPSLIDNHKEELENSELLNIKISNKEMEKILRRLLGFKGEYVQVKQEEKHKEWSFGNGSFSRIEKDDDGTPILSVVDTGEDGDDWKEYKYPLKDVKQFLSDLKEENMPKNIETPLHERNIIEIEKAIQQNMQKNYTPEVGERLKTHIKQIWSTSGMTNSIEDICQHTHRMGIGTVADLLRKWDVPVSKDGRTFEDDSDAWKRIAYSDYITPNKTKNANDYLIDHNGRLDTFALIESAKKWTPNERGQARKDLIQSRSSFQSENNIEDFNTKRTIINSMTHKSTEFIPFDLFSDLMANGLKFEYRSTIPGEDGVEKLLLGNHFNTEGNSIIINNSYLMDNSIYTKNEDPFYHKPKPIQGYIQHRYSDVVSHEIAHALDHFLSGGTGYLDWDTPMGRKYSGKHIDCVSNSYTEAVNKSNPDKLIGKYPSSTQPYFYHRDEWMSSYEGRIYGNKNDPTGVANMKRDKDGNLFDDGFSSVTHGIEHWSENVARYANAFHAYRNDTSTQTEKQPIDKWASGLSKEFVGSGYGTAHEREKNPELESMTSAKRDYPIDAYAHEFNLLKKNHPTLYKGINYMFNRSDFIDNRSHNDRPTEAYKRGEYIRRSINLIIDL